MSDAGGRLMIGERGRRWAAALALFAAAMVLLQLYITLAADKGGTVPERVVRLFSFFTILTNSLVAIVCARAAAGRGRPALLAGTAIWILVVGLVYNILLRQVWHPEGLQLIVDNGLHVVVPIGYCAWWWAFAPKADWPWQQAIRWLGYPSAYTAYAITRGTLTGDFPYWFMNYPKLGVPMTVAWLSGVLALFLALGLGTVALARRSAANQ